MLATGVGGLDYYCCATMSTRSAKIFAALENVKLVDVAEDEPINSMYSRVVRGSFNITVLFAKRNVFF